MQDALIAVMEINMIENINFEKSKYIDMSRRTKS
jgi:hypothetical protein